MNRESIKYRFMAVRFMIWDLHLYLDTHPDDTQAAGLLQQYASQYSELLREYEQKYGPLTAGETGYGDAWLQPAWPWDLTKEGC